MVRAILSDKKRMTRRLATSPLAKCAAGDRLWVREAFAEPNDQVVIYRANWREDAIARGLDNIPVDDSKIRWRPSILMPRWACRITLTVTAVKIEPLQEISEDDSVAEGIRQMRCGGGSWVGGEGPGRKITPWPTAKEAFRDLWESLYGPDAWKKNPTVVAISFQREAR
jgi:hypothetical protein